MLLICVFFLAYCTYSQSHSAERHEMYLHWHWEPHTVRDNCMTDALQTETCGQMHPAHTIHLFTCSMDATGGAPWLWLVQKYILSYWQQLIYFFKKNNSPLNFLKLPFNLKLLILHTKEQLKSSITTYSRFSSLSRRCDVITSTAGLDAKLGECLKWLWHTTQRWQQVSLFSCVKKQAAHDVIYI